ncbi:MAG: HlyC/CorC family transporter [Anaerolineaceae bacterium]|nr:MAG: HlyC/CorC family transporter [Anaerolineaceae bacterium]
MDSSDAARAVILLILLLLSAFFSGSETALTAINKLRMRSLADDNIRGAKVALKLIEDPTKMLSALLIGNNVVNLSASALATTMAIDIWGNNWVGLATGVLTLVILVFGEITPKSISAIKAEKIALQIAGPVLVITKLLTPIIFIINKLCNGVMRLFRIDPNEKPTPMTESELRTILEVSHEEGVLESEERRMITNVVDFGDSLAKDVMVPRIDMSFASVDLTYDELVQLFSVDKYTRLPVYSENRDNVIGIVNLKDIFFYNGNVADFNILDIIREPYFTYEFKKTSELLIEMRKDSIALAIVLDEYGATAGLITIEDLLEEIVGEIRDEYDEDEEDCIQAVSDKEFIVDGNTKLDDINDALGLDIESSDYDSIAGHIIYLLDHLPEEGESVTENNAKFTVASVDKNRIDKVHIILANDEDAEASND